MKKKLISIIAVLTMASACVAGCGSTQTQETNDNAEVTEAATVEASAAAEEATVQMANPWVEISEEEASEACARLFKAPEGATNVTWRICKDLGNPEQGIGPLVQLDFTLDDMPFTARAQQGASEDADIAGNYVEWTVGPEDTTLANWGEGNMTGKFYRSIGDTGYVDMITWYDIEIGISYSLSVAAADLDGFDIQAVAEQMYNGENEPFADMPADFLQEQSGIVSFATYDDVIAALQPGQGYAYIKLTGSDEEVLAVTDLVFEADHSAYEISVYAKPNGKVSQVGNVSGNGSAYPVRLEDGIIYAGDNHSYETYFLSKEYVSLMMKDYISDGVSTGTNELTGFTRESNSFDDETADFTGTQEDFEKLLQERDTKPAIEFTMVE